ncbi:MAG: SEC-C domain-containing protein [Magnetococcales bacterium]|nr:SEC-C domain-containing protein [Magnetococcales bacterium]
MAMTPQPEQGFAAKPAKVVPPPKIGRNDPCPCGSGKKFKQCHIDNEDAVIWKIGSPTHMMRAMATTRILQNLGMEELDKIPAELCAPLALAELAAAYHREGELNTALTLLNRMLVGDRDDPFLLIDYWIARYAEWLVDAGQVGEAERFLLEEHRNQRKVTGWQVAQKLAAFYIDQDNLESAETWVDISLAGNQDNPFTHYLRGLLNHARETWDIAVEAYERADALSHHFQEQERAYMLELLTGALERARQHLPLLDETENEDEPETDSPDQEAKSKE